MDASSVTPENYDLAVAEANVIEEGSVCSKMKVRIGTVEFRRDDELPTVIRPESVSIVKDIQCVTHVTLHASWVVSIRWKWTQQRYDEVEASLLSVAPVVTLRLIRVGIEHVTNPHAEAYEILGRVFLFLYGGATPPTSSVLVPTRTIGHATGGTARTDRSQPL